MIGLGVATSATILGAAIRAECLLQVPATGSEVSLEGFTMDDRRNTIIRRRDVLLVVTASAVAAVVGAASIPSARTDRAVRRDKRRPQYQANSPEVQDFYRVNRYPGK
jgi:hypothetical protein